MAELRSLVHLTSKGSCGSISVIRTRGPLSPRLPRAATSVASLSNSRNLAKSVARTLSTRISVACGEHSRLTRFSVPLRLKPQSRRHPGRASGSCGLYAPQVLPAPVLPVRVRSPAPAGATATERRGFRFGCGRDLPPALRCWAGFPGRGGGWRGVRRAHGATSPRERHTGRFIGEGVRERRSRKRY
jgi:hypothetical protein